MPSSYTTNHNLEKPAEGEQSGSWGDTINSNMDIIDSAIKTSLDSITITANNSTDETVYPVFVDGATGSQGLESDTGLTYNPSSGVLTATSFTGTVTGNVTGNASGSAGSCTGNAATATTLATARDIGGVSFNGSASINLPGVNTSGNQDTSGNAATATLATSITASANDSTDETVYPTFVDGATGTQGLETDTGLSYNPSTGVLTTTSVTGNLTGNVTGNTSGSSGSCTGNAATATALATGRTIGGVSFDGTGNINLPGVNTAGDQNTSGNAATATVATSVTASANDSTDETVYLTFVDGATGTQGIETDTGLSYNPSSGVITATQLTGNVTGNVTGNTSGSSGSCTGNAATATALASARTIGGVSFDGTGNINLPGVNTAGDQDTSGTAALATSFTASANNSTDETVYPVFVDGATGTQGAETDTGLFYNPSSGQLTTAKARIGTGSAAADLTLAADVTPTTAVGGSSKAAIFSTGGTGSGTFHVGFEIPSNDTADGFFISTDSDQDGTVDTVAMKIKANGYVGILKTNPTTALDVTGTITGDTKSFSIPHPLASKVETHKLIHGSVESPRYDLIYRGKVTLESGAASVNIDTVSSMTEGTLVALCRDLQSFTTNESGWTAVKSSLSGNTLSIEAQDDSCTDEISWMVIGERKDPNVVSADLTDNTGRIIVEMPLPEEEEILGED